MRILMTGLHRPNSGLSMVMDRMARHASITDEVEILGFEPEGSGMRTENREGLPTTIVPTGMRFRLTDEIVARMLDPMPDVVLVMGSAFICEGVLAQVSRHPRRRDARVVLYLATEGEPTLDVLTDVVAMSDACVLYTPSAKASVDLLIDRRMSVDPSYAPPTTHVVGHGVDHHADDHGQGLSAVEAGSTRVLVVARPYPRKRLDLAIAGFAMMAREHGEASMILHTGRMPQRKASEMRDMIAGHGMQDRIEATDRELTACDLLSLYRSCGIGLSTAMGEGWGLPAFEHAMTGAAQILPGHTGFMDNWKDAAVLMPCRTTETSFQEYSTMHVTTPRDVAQALGRLLGDPDHRRRMGMRARTRASSPRYAWDVPCGQMMDIIHRGAKT